MPPKVFHPFQVIFLFIFSLICSLICLQIYAQENWEATLQATSDGPKGSSSTLTFTTQEGATVDYDSKIDRAAPPPPFAPVNLDIYFPLQGHRFVSRLLTDAKPFSPTQTWTLKLRADTDGGSLSWDLAQIPGETSVMMQLPDQTEINMRQTAQVAYVAKDGQHQTYVITVKTSEAAQPVVVPTNLQPVSLTFEEDSTDNDITLTATVSNNQPLTFKIETQPTNGTLSGVPPNLAYSPNPNFAGTDSFTFATESGNETATQTVVITVKASEAAQPVALDQSVETLINQPKRIPLESTDVGSSELTYSIILQPSHGTLSATSPDHYVTYTPQNGYTGVDSFTFKTNDGQLDSLLATVSITVVSDPAPQNLDWSPKPAIAEEDSEIEIELKATDRDPVDGTDNPISFYQIISLPSFGQIIGVDSDQKTVSGEIVYKPEPDFPYTSTSASDSFSFVANDGASNSTVQVVSVTVAPVADAPVSEAQDIQIIEDSTDNPILLFGADPDQDELTFQVVSDPSNGILSGLEPNLYYTPAVDFVGLDTFSYMVTDSTGHTSSPSTVSITITPINDSPVADDLSIVILENSVDNAITLTASDSDGDVLSFSILNQPVNGQLRLEGNIAYYTPDDNVSTDRFTFKVNDGQLDSSEATVAITVGLETVVSIDPVIGTQTSLYLADGEVQVEIPSGSDPAISSIEVSVAYSDFKAIETAQTDLEKAEVAKDIVKKLKRENLPNLTPVAEEQIEKDLRRAVGPMLSIQIKKNDGKDQTDFQDHPLQIRVPKVGDANALVLADATGSELIPTTVDGTILVGELHHLSLVFSVVNLPPRAEPQTLEVDEDAEIGIMLSASDQDSDSLTYVIVTEPSNGKLSGLIPNMTYTPNTNYNGTDNFSFKVNDGAVDSSMATVSIAITPQNDPPTVADISLTTQEDIPLPILFKQDDIDGDSLTYAIITPPQNGSLSESNGQYTYTPKTNFFGADNFTYRANDGIENSLIAKVMIVVEEDPEAPLLASLPDLTLLESVRTKTVSLVATDDEEPLIFSVTSSDEEMVWADIIDQQLHLTLPNIRYGETQILVTVTDPSGFRDTESFQVSVLPAEDKPATEEPAWVVVDEDSVEGVSVALSSLDLDADLLTCTVVNPPDHGQLSTLMTVLVNGEEKYAIYRPNPDFFGVDQFSYQVSDGVKQSQTVVKVAVIPVNDAPIAVSLTGERKIQTTELETPIQLKAEDSDDDELTFKLVEGPKYGRLKGIAPNLTYVAPLDFSGLDYFTFKVIDEATVSQVATVEIVRNFATHRLHLPQGFTLIHLPFKVMGKNLNGDRIPVEVKKVSDLYDLIGGEAANFLILYETKLQRWVSYLGRESARGGQTDLSLTPGQGVFVVMKRSVTLDLYGNPYQKKARIVLKRGVNLAGIPIKDPRLTQVSDILRLQELAESISTIIVYDQGVFRPINRPGDRGDVDLTGTEGLIVVATRDIVIDLTGVGWPSRPSY